MSDSSAISVYDLTAQVGSQSLAKLHPEFRYNEEYAIQTSLGQGRSLVNIRWYKSSKPVPSKTELTPGQIFLVGPGSLNQLDALRTSFSGTEPRSQIFILTPNALLEEVRLQKTLPWAPGPCSLLRLPSGDPEAFWAVLLEEIRKFQALDHSQTGFFQKENEDMSLGLKDAMSAAMTIEGAMATAIVDYTSGMCLAQAGGGMNLDLAAAGNTQVVRAKLKTMESLGLKKGIEDILITLGDQYHLIRLAPNHPGLFIYLVLDKARGNLALARYKLSDIERTLKV